MRLPMIGLIVVSALTACTFSQSATFKGTVVAEADGGAIEGAAVAPAHVDIYQLEPATADWGEPIFTGGDGAFSVESEVTTVRMPLTT